MTPFHMIGILTLIFCFSFCFFKNSQGSLCMSAGIKTPKRWELMISNTTFVNFDLKCVAIRTCSGCSQGQGKLEQTRQMVNKTSAQVSMTNSGKGFDESVFLSVTRLYQ